MDVGPYQVHIGDLGKAFRDFMARRRYSKVMLIADEHTQTHCMPLFLEKTGMTNLPVISIPAGEQHKNIDACRMIWHEMMRHTADRQSLTINLGGGVIGDMGGFCAGTFKRGMDFVQVPTTLLSQVDASIGGKLGIDFEGIKNSIGIFQDPEAVFIDPDFLRTLPEEEIKSGFGEIIKHALIGQPSEWESLKKLRDLREVDWQQILVPSLNVKRRIVQEDPYERGIRKALNFGHTIGHAVESLALNGDRPLTHGAAIAIGMVCETWLSCKTVGLPTDVLDDLTELVRAVYGHHHLEQDDFGQLFALMRQDKKNEDHKINFTLIDEVGHPLVNRNCGENLIQESILYYINLM